MVVYFFIKKQLYRYIFFFFFCQVSNYWDPRTQACWPIASYLSFKFIGDCLGVQHPYQGSRSRSAKPLLFVPDPSWQSPRSASLPFPTPSIHIECVPMFPFLNRISCMRNCMFRSTYHLLSSLPKP